METFTRMQDVEKRIYTSFHEDGILDICIGLLFLVDGLLMATGYPALVGIAVVVLMFYFPLKQIITVPRLGQVHFSRARQQQVRNALIVLSLAGVVVFFMVTFRSVSLAFERWFNSAFEAVFGGIFTLLAWAGFLITRVKRFYLYLLGIPVIFLGGILANWTFPTLLLLMGALIFASGIVALFAFLTQTARPQIPEDESHD